MAPVTIIGLGNPYRCDDGAGIAVARRLRERALPSVTILEMEGEGTTLLDAWRGAGTVFVIDAVLSQAPPGTIHRFDVRSAPLPAVYCRGSTHSFGIAQAIELARTLDWLPDSLIVYGIEGTCLEMGTTLSPEVAAAVDRLVARLEAAFGNVDAQKKTAVAAWEGA